MREILFRGKKESTGEWVFGDLRHYRSGKVGVHSDILRYTLLVDPESVGQYTGLKIRGEKIFEGDIAKITDQYGNSVVYVVEFYRGGFSLKQKGVDYWAQFIDFHLKPYELEVIGNIHDNPEILKEGGEE